ncbi:MAG TPA: GLPGLI family protein [Mucilaginibacter sp.]|nr:GLPGLI family protein [Mucilaginibacter sp.]
MKTLTIIIISAMLFGLTPAFAQNAHFTNSGVIEYEKSVNMFALLKKQVDQYKDDSFLEQAYEQYRKNQPQFKKLKSTLSFTDNKTKFVPAEADDSRSFFGNNAMVSQNNTVFSDYNTHSVTEQKSVFEETFLLKDSTRKIHWKITDETREIAGFMCRRANAIMLDSIYVVAFYAERIPTPGGPESFCGLPGMILGVALPHENITWFATKVTENVPDSKSMAPPKKGRATDTKGLRETLDRAIKDWGNWGQVYFKAFLL